LLQQQAHASPKSTAVRYQGRHITYEELDGRAAALAQQIEECGVAPEMIVGLLGQRDPDFLIGLLAILKSGGAFLPLSPSSPPAWIAGVLRDCRAPVVVAGTDATDVLASVTASLHPSTPAIIPIRDDRSDRFIGYISRPLLAPANLAYVIYTSGSTGRPKGAMIEHRGLSNHIRAKISHLRLSSSDVVAATAPQSFDILIWQFLAVLTVGGVVSIIPDEVATDPGRLTQELVDGEIRILEVVPSMLREMLEGELPPASRLALRTLIVTGEAIAPDLCRRWLARYPQIPLLNAYGPTECSDDVTHQDINGCEAIGRGTVPIGQPIPGVQLHIVDAQLAPVPEGESGELCVAGAAVGRGYLGDAARTAAAFVPNPLGIPGSRMYRTGDQARLLAGCTLELLSRLDQQIKIRGCRIEPAEIEAVLEEHPAVRQAVIVTRDFGLADTRLVAYVSAAPTLGVAALRRHAMERLPAYMAPSMYLLLDRLPLTAHGKVDRRSLAALPMPSPEAPHQAAAEAEDIIAGVWQRLLRVARIESQGNFFDLGGDSLLLVRAQREFARIFNRNIPIVDLYAHPTVRSLAEYLRGDSPVSVVKSARARAGFRAARRGRLQRNLGGDR
jgi:amino acid adenylation domain-containing protein